MQHSTGRPEFDINLSKRVEIMRIIYTFSFNFALDSSLTNRTENFMEEEILLILFQTSKGSAAQKQDCL